MYDLRMFDDNRFNSFKNRFTCRGFFIYCFTNKARVKRIKNRRRIK